MDKENIHKRKCSIIIRPPYDTVAAVVAVAPLGGLDREKHYC